MLTTRAIVFISFSMMYIGEKNEDQISRLLAIDDLFGVPAVRGFRKGRKGQGDVMTYQFVMGRKGGGV